MASCIVLNDDREVLLVKRKKDPYKDMWCLPIGFAESGEEVSAAALRELNEEAGITGEIIRLIDVDTVENYFYGSLAIVTYEVKQTGGTVKPGDDASDAACFSLDEIPPLAWSSNERALEKFIEIYSDTWKMLDSFRHLFPDMETREELSSHSEEHYSFLSNVLVQVIDRDMETISRTWKKDVSGALPESREYMDQLHDMNRNVLRGVQYWLRKKDTLGIEEFIETGLHLRELGISLADVLTAMALSRRSLWKHIVGKRILTTPLEIYTVLEINNRIIFFYDKINYYLALGYLK